jgi:hypothetical protein
LTPDAADFPVQAVELHPHIARLERGFILRCQWPGAVSGRIKRSLAKLANAGQ